MHCSVLRTALSCDAEVCVGVQGTKCVGSQNTLETTFTRKSDCKLDANLRALTMQAFSRATAVLCSTHHLACRSIRDSFCLEPHLRHSISLPPLHLADKREYTLAHAFTDTTKLTAARHAPDRQ